MRAADNSARNLFARLKSLAVEDRSRRIENFCTESLAFLLLNSDEFQRRFLRLIGHTGRGTGFLFNTQEFCRAKTGGSHEGEKNYFDLVAVSDLSRRVYIIEVKASTGFPDDQLPKYRAAAARSYQGFSIRLISLSPHAEGPIGSDLHRTWNDVAKQISKIPGPAPISWLWRNSPTSSRTKV